MILVTPPPNNHYFKTLKRLANEDGLAEIDLKNTLIGQDQTIRKLV